MTDSCRSPPVSVSLGLSVSNPSGRFLGGVFDSDPRGGNSCHCFQDSGFLSSSSSSPGRPRWCDILLYVFQMAGRRTRLAISLLLIHCRRRSRCSSIPFALTLRSVSCAPKKKKEKKLQKTKAGRLSEALAGTYTCPAHMWRYCKSSCIVKNRYFLCNTTACLYISLHVHSAF